MIRPDQIKTIHALKRTLGLTEEVYRDMLKDACSVTSSKDIRSAGEAEQLIRALRALTGATPYPQGKAKYEHLGERPGMATPKQLRMIEAMWADVSFQPSSKAREKALQTLLLDRYRIGGILWIEDSDVQRVVKGLQQMKRLKDAKQAAKQAEKGGKV
jgi:hypothetical protein